MNLPDTINGAFEFGGSLAVWVNVWALWKDKGYKGARLAPMLFFSSFSLWNLWYYPHLGQWASLTGGIILGLANCAYVGLMLKFRTHKENHIVIEDGPCISSEGNCC